MPIIPYIRFAAVNRRFVGFGFLMAFGSSFGQTYFVGIFGPAIQMEFALSHTVWGTIYMIGTLASAVLLPWTGKQIDRFDLRRYTAWVCLLLILACAFTSFVDGIAMLVIAVFLLRQGGQGLMSHVSVTSMVRYFDAGERGRAIAIATLGFAVGEAFLPLVAVIAIAAIGWRWSYGGVALFLALCLLPAALVLLRGHGERHRAHLARLADTAVVGSLSGRSWTRAEMLRDPVFYLLLPGLLAPALIVTALFFHHLNLADAKGWSHAWITGSYTIYAAAIVLTSLTAGPLVDRLGAVRLVPFMLTPLAFAMIVIAVFSSPWIAWLYFVLIGINTGIAHTAVSAMWAEVYGVAHLGAIKSLTTALSVFASALGPVIMGALMDLGMPIQHVCLVFSLYTVGGAILIAVALRGRAALMPERVR